MTSGGKWLMWLGTVAALFAAAIVGYWLGVIFQTCDTRQRCEWNEGYALGGFIVALVMLELLVIIAAFVASISGRLRESVPVKRKATGERRKCQMEVSRKVNGQIEPREFRPAVISALRYLDGRARAEEVMIRVSEILPLTAEDKELASMGKSPNIYWKDQCHQTVAKLREEGVLMHWEESGHGWWQFANDGEKMQ